MEPAQAAAQVAVRRLKRASGLLKEATRDLASVGDTTVAGTHHVHDAASARAALELIEVGVGRYGAVDVVVIARPTGRAQHPHHGPR